MKDLKKNLIYWGKTLEWLSVSMIVGILCYVLAMSFMGGSFSEEELKNSLLGYVWIFVCISIFVNAFTATSTYFPLTISLGSTRKGSFAAMQIMQHVIVFQYLILGAVAYYFFEREIFGFMMKCSLTIVGAFLLLMTLANVTCMVWARYGKTVGIVVYIVSLIIVVALVVVVMISATTNEERYQGAFLEMMREWMQKPYLFIIGAVFDAVSVGLYYRAQKKNDLQF